mmetsp:Transcript_26399/g.48329  ORF Transcript_26399/g.48329 Transcript_26399/m.48329 type:complete len:87 (+) Transcript_26399:78-338(+)
MTPPLRMAQKDPPSQTPVSAQSTIPWTMDTKLEGNTSVEPRFLPINPTIDFTELKPNAAKLFFKRSTVENSDVHAPTYPLLIILQG